MESQKTFGGGVPFAGIVFIEFFAPGRCPWMKAPMPRRFAMLKLVSGGDQAMTLRLAENYDALITDHISHLFASMFSDSREDGAHSASAFCGIIELLMLEHAAEMVADRVNDNFLMWKKTVMEDGLTDLLEDLLDPDIKVACIPDRTFLSGVDSYVQYCRKWQDAVRKAL